MFLCFGIMSLANKVVSMITIHHIGPHIACSSSQSLVLSPYGKNMYSSKITGRFRAIGGNCLPHFAMKIQLATPFLPKRALLILTQINFVGFLNYFNENVGNIQITMLYNLKTKEFSQPGVQSFSPAFSTLAFY